MQAYISTSEKLVWVGEDFGSGQTWLDLEIFYLLLQLEKEKKADPYYYIMTHEY